MAAYCSSSAGGAEPPNIRCSIAMSASLADGSVSHSASTSGKPVGNSTAGSPSSKPPEGSSEGRSSTAVSPTPQVSDESSAEGGGTSSGSSSSCFASCCIRATSMEFSEESSSESMEAVGGVTSSTAAVANDCDDSVFSSIGVSVRMGTSSRRNTNAAPSRPTTPPYLMTSPTGMPADDAVRRAAVTANAGNARTRMPTSDVKSKSATRDNVDMS
mmetsp:Transcript_36078/g.95068  ORF Transcript_36078/g.95068 Transcript_36078/m.95068 type:complete len:215 (+) Transcript_36078:195-839(+)